MIALPLSIIFATYLVVCFKYFGRFGIRNLHAIIFNYITCVITGIVITGEVPDISKIIHRDWFPFAAFLGCSFFCIFNLMGYVTNTSGVTVTSVASKLSMVIPVMAAVILYKDPLSSIKIGALLLALIAVYLTSKKEESADHSGYKMLALPFIIFIGTGLNDSLINHASLRLITAEEFDVFNTVIFFFASLCGLIVLAYEAIKNKKAIPLKAVAGGIALGVPNYFSLLFLIKALNIPGMKSSVIFPVNNIGIVVLSAIFATLLFREKLSKMNIAGIAIGILAISLMLIE